MRRIPLSRRSHIIGFQPLATGTAAHESALERDFVTLTSFLDPTATITAQPVTIWFQDGARRRRYTPDFLVHSDIVRSELIEVKYRQDLCANWDRLKAGFAAAQVRAREEGGIFRVVTEREIRGPVLDNAKRLLPLRGVELDPELASRALSLIGSLVTPTFGVVLSALPMSRSVSLATLWRLIAHGRLRVDFSVPITLDTKLLPL